MTERKQLRADAAVQQKNAVLKSVFEGTGEAIFVKHIEGRYLIVNSAVANFYKKPIEEIIGKIVFDLTDFESARQLTMNDKSIMETGERVTVACFRESNRREVCRSPKMIAPRFAEEKPYLW